MIDRGHVFPWSQATGPFGLFDNGVMLEAPSAPAVTAFVDDMASMAPIDIAPVHLIPSISALPALVAEKLGPRGMIWNCKRGKSGLLLHIAGRGSDKAKRTLAGVDSVRAGDSELSLITFIHTLAGPLKETAACGLK